MVWRTLALLCAALAFVMVVGDMIGFPQLGDDRIVTKAADGRSFDRLKVVAVNTSASDAGGILPGDIITPADVSLAARTRTARSIAGDVENFSVDRGIQHFTTSVTLRPIDQNQLYLLETFGVVRITMIFIAVLLIVRRPEATEARALVGFLVALGATLAGIGQWLPGDAFLAFGASRIAIQIFSLAEATRFACIFPFRSDRGLRAWIGRVTPWYSLVLGVASVVFTAAIYATDQLTAYPAFNEFVRFGGAYYFGAIALAFTLASAAARGVDKQRVNWAGLSIGAGFVGPLISLILTVGFHVYSDALNFLSLTVTLIPIGLAYTILRHRTIDVGFVVSRALVLTLVSFIIIGAFGLLERAFGKFFIEASHLTSRSVEIALALGLGFSLRSLHARIERIVDRTFFRQRHAALAALRSFTKDVEHITDPDVVIERTVEVVARETGAENAALYLIADGAFGCAVAISAVHFEPEVDENDPLFVRLRALRGPANLRGIGSAIDAETAFPLFVRATLVGALVLTAKRSGETYDPEETALIEELAQRACLTLDALQTIAMRRELAALIDAHAVPAHTPRVAAPDKLPPRTGVRATSGATSAV